MIALIKKISNKLCRKYINKRNRQRLQNQQISVIASNCNGALILHDLNQTFRSPFVNLYLAPADFLRYLQKREYYQSLALQFITTDKVYPVAMLGDIQLHFVHYHSPQEAQEKWQTRSQRINFDNVFVIMTDRDGCTYADLQAFDQLPFANKVVFTHRPYPELKSAYYIRGFENQGQVGDLYEWSGWFGLKYYDQFDYVAWFNAR